MCRVDSLKMFKVNRDDWLVCICIVITSVTQHIFKCFSLSFPVCVLQLLSDSQINMVKVVNSVSDALNAMQKENVGLKARVKADLQRAPVRGARFKGCSNGKRNEAWLDFMYLSCGLGFLYVRFSFSHILFLPLSLYM